MSPFGGKKRSIKMAKCILIEETDNPTAVAKNFTPRGKITEFSSNPLEPIKKVFKNWSESESDIDKPTNSGFGEAIREIFLKKRGEDAWQAISECMKRVEGK